MLRGLAALCVVLVGMATTADMQEVNVLSDSPLMDREALVQVQAGAGKISIDINGDEEGDDTPEGKAQGYDKIPGFVFRHMGQEESKPNKEKCEQLCDENETCRSFSFSPPQKLCVWSVETIQYRMGWEFYTKVRNLDPFGKLQHYGKWRSFPDIMYQEPGYAKHEGVSPAKCQDICMQEKEKCNAFSYDTKKLRCFLTDSGIHYDPTFIYYERRGMAPKPNAMDEADKQEAIQADERSAKKAKRARLIKSMGEMEKNNDRAMSEMKSKSNFREVGQKRDEKETAEKRLVREKSLEARDKRLAKMKAVYNEGYFKAKGVAAEKKSKEKDIKKLQAKEFADKDRRKKEQELMAKRKKLDRKEKARKQNGAKDRLVAAKEKITKVKNQEIELEIEKEDKVLDVAKNLALAKYSAHSDSVMNEKDNKVDALKKEKRRASAFKQQMMISDEKAKVNKKQLSRLTKMSEDKQYDSHDGATGNSTRV